MVCLHQQWQSQVVGCWMQHLSYLESLLCTATSEQHDDAEQMSQV